MSRGLLTTVLVLAAASAPAQAAKAAAKPPLVPLRWHLIVRGVTSVRASDRYLAYATSTGMTVVDQQTQEKTEFRASPCSDTEPPYPILGGPWVAACSNGVGAPQQSLELYDAVDGSWLSRPIPEDCGWLCFPVAVGSQWIELATPNCPYHCSPSVFLRNIATGQTEPDPVQPGVGFREDLDSPTGTSPLCPPLRYPAMVYGSSEQVEPGNLAMLGQFALTTGLGGASLLERCRSTWRKWLYGQALGGSRMVLWSDGLWISKRTPNHGLLLPSLRRFNFTIPPRLRPGEPSLAISGRTIYVLTYGGVLWAARVPRIG